MGLGPKLALRQTQSLVMTPQLQQAIKLLALSNIELEGAIAEAIESNPLLENGADLPQAGVGQHDDGDPTGGIANSTEETPVGALMGSGDEALDIDPGSLDIDRDTGDATPDGNWALNPSHASEDTANSWENRDAGAVGLSEHLTAQIGAAVNDPTTRTIAEYLIGQLDDAGYLTESLENCARALSVSYEAAERALTAIQTLDPTGVGARDLSECLKLQAIEADRCDPCMARFLDHLDLVARGEFARLKRICNCDDDDLASMLADLRSFDPKPGLRYAAEHASAVTPDILVSPGSDGGWQVRLNEDSLPKLVINRRYYAEIKRTAHDKDGRAWLNEKLSDANWLIRALDQRQKTILKTAIEIVKHQEGFFRNGVGDLRPLTLREVAEAIDMHESTVSRVTSNKYLSCDRGTFELKFFFTSGIGSADGEGASSEAVKARIKALIDAEDGGKILSDDRIVELLREEGYDLARRTVAKYREAAGIGSSIERRRAKKLAKF